MPDDPMDAVSSFVERAYVRMQAGEVLLYCLEREDSAPMRTLVEELVLAGPQSLNTLREVLAEVGARRGQLQNDLHQVFSDLDQKLRPFGLHLADQYTPHTLARLNSLALLGLLQAAGTAESQRADCLHTLQNAQDMLASLIRHLRLMDEMETHLRDWLWSLIYQSTQQEWSNRVNPASKKTELL